jgi:4-hydroxy-3-polyprenylbenzoate decarboxylase
VAKQRSLASLANILAPLEAYLRIVVVVDRENNDIHNPYMLLWRVANNLDAQRDICVCGAMVSLDGTTKSAVDGFDREWPKDVVCSSAVVNKLKSLSLWDLEIKKEQKYQL